jgi:hypothetical protein
VDERLNETSYKIAKDTEVQVLTPGGSSETKAVSLDSIQDLRIP